MDGRMVEAVHVCDHDDNDNDVTNGKILPHRVDHHRTSTRRKSNSQSCGSLYNLAASSRPLHPQRSEPNVSFYSSPGEHQHDDGGGDDGGYGRGGTIDADYHVQDSSNTLDDAPVLESCESLGATGRRSRRSGGGGRLHHDDDDGDGADDDGSYGSSGLDALDDRGTDDDGMMAGCLGGGGGGGGGSGTGGHHQHAAPQHGLRASIVSVLGRLGMWNTNKPPGGKPVPVMIHRSETKSSFDRGQSYISNGASRLRSIFGGKIEHAHRHTSQTHLIWLHLAHSGHPLTGGTQTPPSMLALARQHYRS